MRRAQREQNIPEDEVEISPEDEVENDEDPIEVLKREVEAHKTREAETEKRLADERRQRELLERQAALHNVDKLANDKALLEQSFAAADAKAAEAKRLYATHASEGRWEDAAEAQRELLRIEHSMIRMSERYQDIERQEKAPKPAAPAAPAIDEYDAGVARIAEPELRSWAMEHKSDLLQPDRQRLALAANDLALARGLKPGSEEYLDFLDDQMGYEMDDTPPPEPRRAPPARRAPSVAAPVSRSAGGRTQSVTLTPQEKNWASQLGISEKEYAKSKVEAMNNGKYNRYSGRS